MTHAFNPSIQKTGTRISVSLWTAFCTVHGKFQDSQGYLLRFLQKVKIM